MLKQPGIDIVKLLSQEEGLIYMITELQARKMTNLEVLEVAQKSCLKYGVKMLHANYIKDSMNLFMLVDDQEAANNVVMELTGVLIGIINVDLEQVDDAVYLTEQESDCCPIVTAIDDETEYKQECNLRMGEDLS